jgi:hypothetical protein
MEQLKTLQQDGKPFRLHIDADNGAFLHLPLFEWKGQVNGTPDARAD